MYHFAHNTQIKKNQGDSLESANGASRSIMWYTNNFHKHGFKKISNSEGVLSDSSAKLLK